MSTEIAQAPKQRLLPSNIDAEKAVLGGVLVHPRLLPELLPLVEAADFYHPAHVAIFAAMASLDASSKPVDPITVADEMHAMNSYRALRAFNGESYFAELTAFFMTPETLPHHARSIRSLSVARRLIEVAQEITGRGLGDYGDPDEFIADAERQVLAVTGYAQPRSYRPIKALLKETITAVEKRHNAQSAVTGIPWGFERLDEVTGGMQPEQSIVIAGRPGMGKTALAMGIAWSATTGANILRTAFPALVVELEMSDTAITERALSGAGRVDNVRLRNGCLEQRDWVGLTRAAKEISGARLHVYSGGATMEHIRAMARRWRARETRPDEPALLVVDHIGLIARNARERAFSREQEISGYSRALKQLARDLRIVLVLLVQLNRACEDRPDKRPRVPDLRESGAIEQDADVIALLYRDEVYNAESADKGVAEVIIGKQRDGATGTELLRFEGPYTRFSDL